MILLLDNYDSFVFNLARYLQELGQETYVVRNDAVTVSQIEQLAPQAIVISPGPCTPREAGISVQLIRELGPQIPMLGVCLGHQAIATALGGEVLRALEPVHGRTAWIRHYSHPLFEAVSNPFRAMRYHSLIVREASLPDDLSAIARSTDGLLMALQHRDWPLFGVQFHPESILTEGGHRILSNFLCLAGIEAVAAPAAEFCEPASNESDWHSTEIDAIPSRPM